MEQMFEKASRAKIRFETSKGNLTVEDLWDLPLTSNTGKANLDDIARGLHSQLKEADEISFVNPVVSSNDNLKLGFEIVKHVISVRLDEANKRANEAAAKEKKQKIMAIIDQKQDAALSAMSVEELRQMVASL